MDKVYKSSVEVRITLTDECVDQAGVLQILDSILAPLLKTEFFKKNKHKLGKDKVKTVPEMKHLKCDDILEIPRLSTHSYKNSA